jgi:hypothetical protein
VIGACTLGLAFYGAAVLLERLASPEHRHAPRTSSRPQPSQSPHQQHTGGLAPGGAAT